MNILEKLLNRSGESRSFMGSTGYYSGSSYSSSKAAKLSAVYRCVEVISSSVAQLPLEPYRIGQVGDKVKYSNADPVYQLLNRKPCSCLTRYEFIKLLVTSMLLDGNGYAYISRDTNGKAKELVYLMPSEVMVAGDRHKGVTYSIPRLSINCQSCDMIHLKNFTRDGIIGVSTIAMAAETLGISYDSEGHARNFFKSGGAISGILSIMTGVGNVKPDQIKDIKTEFANNFGSINGQAGGVAVIANGQSFQPIKVSPADAQLLESRKFNVVEICRFFGVSPVKAFDLSNSSYATVEATQLSFLTDTLSPLLDQIELEFVTKIFLPSEQANVEVRFNTDHLLKADKAAMGSYYTSLFNIGVMSQNDVRRNLDMPDIEGGDTYFIQGNLSTPEKIKTVTEPKAEKRTRQANKA